MMEFDNQKATDPRKSKPCPRCQGTGFDRPGHICPHIGAASDKGIDYLMEMLGVKEGNDV